MPHLHLLPCRLTWPSHIILVERFCTGVGHVLPGICESPDSENAKLLIWAVRALWTEYWRQSNTTSSWHRRPGHGVHLRSCFQHGLGPCILGKSCLHISRRHSLRMRSLTSLGVRIRDSYKPAPSLQCCAGKLHALGEQSRCL